MVTPVSGRPSGVGPISQTHVQSTGGLASLKANTLSPSRRGISFRSWLGPTGEGRFSDQTGSPLSVKAKLAAPPTRSSAGCARGAFTQATA
jgi:hypothetical protein